MRELTAIDPLAGLQEKIAALMAALVTCGRSPGREAVHGLRTSARRIEAWLALCELLSRLPLDEHEIRGIRSSLKRLRRASSEVSDLDVQQRFIDLVHLPHTNGYVSEESVSKSCSERLRSHLRSVRRKRALKLARVLREEAPSLCKSLRKLEALISEPSPSTESRLCELIQRWFIARVTKITHAKGVANSSYREHSWAKLQAGAHFKRGDKTLHQLRKAAKLASLMTGGLPVTYRHLRAMHEEFRSLQKAGGEWHDWLLLRHRAAHHLGKGNSLIRQYKTEEKAKRRLYRSLLARFLCALQTGTTGS